MRWGYGPQADRLLYLGGANTNKLNIKLLTVMGHDDMNENLIATMAVSITSENMW